MRPETMGNGADPGKTIAADDQKRLFHTLDGVRGAAALAVFLHHFGPTRNWLPGAYLAVDLFFGLSGFVLAFSNDSRLTRGMPWHSFMVQRVIRLYPLYIAGTLLGLVVGVSHHHGARAVVEIVLGLLLLPTIPNRQPNGTYGGQLFPWNWAAWSLFYELLINLGYALTAKFLKVWSLALVAAISFTAIVYEVARYGNIDRGNDYSTFSGGIIRVVFSFSVGLLVYKLWRRGWRIPRIPAPILALSPFLCFWIPGPRLIVEPLLLAVAFPILLLAGASNEPHRTIERLFVVGGEISYPLYTLQAFMLQVGVIVLNSRLGPSLEPYTAALSIAVVPTVLALSWLAYLVDVPTRAALRAAWRRRAPKPSPLTV